MKSSLPVSQLRGSLEKVTAGSVAHHIKGLRPALHVMQALGFSAKDCLTGTGISQQQLEQQDQGISLQQEYAFYRQLLRLSKDPRLGLKLGKAYRLENYGMLGYAILSAPTLGEALNIAREFGPLSFSHFQLDYEIGARESCISMRLNKSLETPLLQLYEDRDCSAIIHGTRTALNMAFPVTRIELMHSTDNPQDYADFFGCPLSFNQTQMAIYFPSTILSQPMPLRDPETSEYCRQQCQQLLHKLNSQESLSQRVSGLLHARAHDFPDLKTVCLQLGLSERSLRRKLADEGCSFQELLNQVRFEKAKQLLKEGLTLEDIAVHLGYSDAGNFSHAFKRWSGLSPKHYRQQTY